MIDSHKFIVFVGLCHFVIMMLELLPGTPFIMGRVIKSWLKAGKITADFAGGQRTLVTTIVRNAGTYNGVVAAGLIAAGLQGSAGFATQATLLAGVVVAGLVGMSLSRITIIQVVLGVAGLIFLWAERAK